MGLASASALNGGYVWWDDARQSQTQLDANTGSSSDPLNYSYLTYDTGGRLSSVRIDDATPRTVYYTNDVSGQVLRRWEQSSSSTNPDERYYYYNGLRVGDIGYNAGRGPYTRRWDKFDWRGRRLADCLTGPVRAHG